MKPLDGLRVLIVDDSEDSLEMACVALENAGASVTCVATAEAGWAAFRGRRPSVVLCDLAMPDHDGYWLLARIRALSPNAGGRVPVAALTAHASGGTRAKALAAGFDKHFAKPIDPLDLVQAVSELVSNGSRGA